MKRQTKKQIQEDIEAAKDLANFLGIKTPVIQRYERVQKPSHRYNKCSECFREACKVHPKAPKKCQCGQVKESPK